MAENSGLNGGEFCAIIFGKGCGSWEEVNNWAVAIPDGKPPVETPTPPPVRNTFSQLCCFQILSIKSVEDQCLDKRI